MAKPSTSVPGLRFSKASSILHLACCIALAFSTSTPKVQAQELTGHAAEPRDLGTAYRSQNLEGYYALRDLNPDPALLSPKAFFGFELGQRHLSHDEMLAYFRYLEKASDRVRLMPYGRSWEQRRLLCALISDPTQLKDAALAKILAAQQALADPNAASEDLPEAQGTPLVLYQGCSVHGNEASGANAAVQYAYQLASSQHPEVLDLLQNNLVLLDPALNPDGIQRFAGWVNMHRGLDADPLPASREHNEAWPGGRTNHYWFDLNRDWLPLTQPESHGRVALFYDWLPQVLTDHHEMGRNSSFFFQPGIPSRTNPITPQRNQELTAKLGAFHARALDAIGSTYYSRESFDDFYYGKGSTFPDVNGSVGILFEQASARGHRQDGENGQLDFAFAIRNQLATLWSTLEGAHALQKELRAYSKAFFEEGLRQGQDAGGGYLFASSGDPARDLAFLERLVAHRLAVHPVQEKLEHEGRVFPAAKAWFVPRAQARSRMVEALFAPTRSVPDSLFYDVSAWTLPMAWGMPYAEWDSKAPKLEPVLDTAPEAKAFMGFSPEGESIPKAAYAYLIHWADQGTPALAGDLLREGYVLKSAQKPIRIQASGPIGTKTDKASKTTPVDFPSGTLVLRSARQPVAETAVAQRMARAAEEGVRIWRVESGQSQDGIDLGSPSLEALSLPKVAILVGPGANAYDAGSLWHELDAVGHYRPTLLALDQVQSRKRLDAFNTVVLPHGYYGSAGDAFWDALESWVREGGHLIAVRNATAYLAKRQWAGLEEAPETEQANTSAQPYAEADRRSGARYLGGAIFKAEGDWTHPLLYGFSGLEAAAPAPLARDGISPTGQAYTLPESRATAAVFLQSAAPFSMRDHPHAAPLTLSPEAPLLSGYAHPASLEQWHKAPLLHAGRMGSGRVTAFAFSPTFRAFWRNTARLLHNAIYLSPTLNSRTLGADGQSDEGQSEGGQMDQHAAEQEILHGHPH